jgi:hypothetical protein
MPVKGSASQGLPLEHPSGCVTAKRAILGELAKRGIHAVPRAKRAKPSPWRSPHIAKSPYLSVVDPSVAACTESRVSLVPGRQVANASPADLVLRPQGQGSQSIGFRTCRSVETVRREGTEEQRETDWSVPLSAPYFASPMYCMLRHHCLRPERRMFRT